MNIDISSECGVIERWIVYCLVVKIVSHFFILPICLVGQEISKKNYSYFILIFVTNCPL
jgi:hypothetical protein